MIIAGKTPKVTMSANESNCAPIADFAFNKRAEKPSKKSNIAAIPIKYPAQSSWLLKAQTIPKQPQIKLQSVNVLGIAFFIENKYTVDAV